MKSLFIIFGSMMMIIATSPFFSFIDGVITDNLTSSYVNVSTTSATAANVTLSKSLFNDNIYNVDVTSNITSDYPEPYSYNSVTKALEISGLADNASRTLLVEYLTDTGNLEAGMVIFWTTLRWLWILVITMLICGSIYAFFD